MGCFDRRRLRRWATIVLGAWLSVLVAGVAHACILPAPAEGGADPAMRAAETASAHALPRSHESATVDDHDGVERAAQVTCGRFCDGEARNVPSAKMPSDPWSHGTLPPPPAAWVVPAPPVAVRLPAVAGTASPPARRLPAAIAFLRLLL